MSHVLPDDFDHEDFLRNYWQKKPLLIRAGRPFVDPVEPDELAGFACEDFIESRLVLHDVSSERWRLRNGPFTSQDFAKLPDTHWSLLVQAVDQWHEGVRSMLKDFSFIPSWRIDDIMVSFASDGGGVGPHFDYYDVFLIQGLGRKRWRLGGSVDSSSPLLPDTELRLLQNFETQEDWIVEPGDILYLPPNIAHHGVAIGDSITYSIGFRTPSVAEIIDDLGSELIQELREDQRYVDTAPGYPQRIGEIAPDISDQLLHLLRTHVLDSGRITRWFGRYMTSPRYPELMPVGEPLSPAQLQDALTKGAQLHRNPASRFAFIDHRHDQGGDSIELYADGMPSPFPVHLEHLLPALCDPTASEMDWHDVIRNDREGADLTTRLYNQGSLLLDDGSEE